LRAGDLAEARRLHGQLVRVLPQSPLTQMVTAQLQLFEGEPARSVRELLLLLQRQPENDAARALLVAAQLHAGALEQALKEANALGASSPEALDLERLREVIREAADLPANSVERALAVASAYLALQQPALARSLLEGAQRAHPGNKGLKAALVGAELRSGRRAQALRSAELLAQDYPGDPAVSVLLAEAQTVNGDFKGASATYEAVWRIAPSGQLALTLARTRRLAQLGDAEWPLHEWLRSHPQDASVRLNLATALQQSDSPGRAVLELERVVAGTPAGHPLRAIALNNLAWLYAESSDPRALDTARQAYEGARAAAFVQDTYGWLLARQDRLKEALPLLEAAAASAPTSAEIRYHYAAVLARSGETQKAALLLQDILQATDPFEGRQEAEQLLASL
jgi:predicted Zn-dependent protease